MNSGNSRLLQSTPYTEMIDLIKKLKKRYGLKIIAVSNEARELNTYRIQNLIWATGYNVVAIPLAAGVLYKWGILLTPAVGAVFMSVSTIVVAINAKMLRAKNT